MQIKFGDVKPVFRLYFFTKNISPRDDLDLFSDVKDLPHDVYFGLSDSNMHHQER